MYTKENNHKNRMKRNPSGNIKDRLAVVGIKLNSGWVWRCFIILYGALSGSDWFDVRSFRLLHSVLLHYDDIN